MPCLEPVVEIPHRSHPFWTVPPAWPVAPLTPGEHVTLSAETAPEEVGTAVHLLLTDNADELGRPDGPWDERALQLVPLTAGERIELLVGAAVPRLRLSGGLRVWDLHTGDSELPDSGHGLEHWRAWQTVYTEDRLFYSWDYTRPLAGRRLGDAVVRVHRWRKVRPFDYRERRPSIDIPLCDFPVLLERVRQDLLDFRDLLVRWAAKTVGADFAPALADAFDRHMKVSAPLVWPDHIPIRAVPLAPASERDRPLPRRRITAPRRRWNKEEHDPF